MFDRWGRDQWQGRWGRRGLSARVNGGAQNNVEGGIKPPLSSPWASKGNTIMIQETPQADLFKQQMRESLWLEILNSRAVTIAKHDHVYTCGDNDEVVY